MNCQGKFDIITKPEELKNLMGPNLQSSLEEDMYESSFQNLKAPPKA